MEGDVVMLDKGEVQASVSEEPEVMVTDSCATQFKDDTIKPQSVNSQLLRALKVLHKQQISVLPEKPSTYDVAKALADPATSPLDAYKASSCMREGLVREVVQLLIFEGHHAVLPALRLLNIMRGMSGNWELTMELLDAQDIQMAKLGVRAMTLIALMGGRKTYRLCNWGPVFESALYERNEEARLAMHMVVEQKWTGNMEDVYDITDWSSEEKHATSPSIWRELVWAKHAQSLCLDVAASEVQAKFGKGCSVEPSPTDVKACFLAPPTSWGLAARHYIRICGTLVRRRSANWRQEGSEAARGNLRIGSEGLPDADGDVVITPSVVRKLGSIANAISCGVPVLLEGNTGCGKTTILSLLSRETMYTTEMGGNSGSRITFVQMDSTMREADGDSFASLIGSVVPLPEAGHFQWRLGPIGTAVEQGHWLVLENIGSASNRKSSVLSIVAELARLQPGDSLSAPGRGAPLTTGRGFRCIATRTTVKSLCDDTWEPPGGWEVWQRVSLEEWSVEDKLRILKGRYPSIEDCISRVVDATERVASYVQNKPGLLVREPTLREAIRICKRLEGLRTERAEALTVENALLETIDVLSAWCSVDEQRKSLLTMLSECWSLPADVGKALFEEHVPSYTDTASLVQIGRSSLKRPQSDFPRSPMNLALTGYTLRMLERSLRCLQLREHILLTGEAGSGKTSLIQELAKFVEKRLVVINLSRQSELGDLIGGFRPLELAAAIPQLVKRFEEAFCISMSRTKNQRFLGALHSASRSSDNHSRAIRLMKGAMDAIPHKVRNASAAQHETWSSIGKDLHRLSNMLVPSNRVSEVEVSGDNDSEKGMPEHLERPRKRQKGKTSSLGASGEQGRATKKRPRARTERRQIEFQFCEGELVRAMRQGSWLLLDEINLAPSELLESLVSILDTGKITLPNGKGEEISQSPGFKLFGAMNPPTDAGKRPLPGVLRARFTELYASDMSSLNDVILLILHRCFRISTDSATDEYQSTVERAIARDVATFFLQCKKDGAEGLLEDFAGKPGRFSLRHLCRMLDFASGLGKYLTRSAKKIRRVLYEGAILAFATPLNPDSQERVKELAFTIILGKGSTGGRRNMALLSEQLSNLISPPADMRSSLHSIGGFPVLSRHSHNADEPGKRSVHFVLTTTVSRTLQDVSRALVLGTPRLPVLLQGPTAAGKTSLISYIADVTRNKLTRINNHEHTELSEYVGSYVATENGSLVFREGPLVQAAREGSWILLDELNLAPPDVLEALNRLLDDNREIFLPETGETVRAADGFTVFATQNPPGLYGGRKELSRAFRSRFVEVQVPDLPDQELQAILESRCRIPQSFARDMITVMRQLQMKRQSSSMFSGKDGFVTARDLFRWASRGPRSKAELAIHGFFLLGERSRREEDKNIVRKEIARSIGVDDALLTDKMLYSFESSPNEPSASQECLDFSLRKLKISRQSLMDAMELERLVSTPHIRRLLTLVIHGIANSEPCLLVGDTGSGKTSCCAVIARAMQSQLLTVSCHRHTQASDILGGFRPARKSSQQLFEWIDGPLVQAMKQGYVALIDEINMADDAVVERMNSVLELERTLLLSEKGTVSSDVANGQESFSSEVITAHQDFRILGTMNPGGDFGKRELSPALRNRFTEVWVPGPCTIEEFSPIINQRLNADCIASVQVGLDQVKKAMHKFLEQPISSPTTGLTVRGERAMQEGFGNMPHISLSVRDLAAWCDFIQCVAQKHKINPILAMLHGARLVFLDGLSVGALNNSTKDIERGAWEHLTSCIPASMRQEAATVLQLGLQGEKNQSLKSEGRSRVLRFGPFAIPHNPDKANWSEIKERPSYSFDAPSTSRNCARLARAISGLSRPILLEGPPGCGKTSLIAAVASTAKYSFVRINLSDATEMSDLIGTDCPGERPGLFSFREGPLLSAMRAGSWVLLDELNLASQSVLEGLNSVLDHRRSVYVSEIDQEVSAHDSFRVFGAQNPATGGGGRRGLPKSFLNRFTRVHVEAPDEEDILHIMQHSNPQLERETARLIIRSLQVVRSDLREHGLFVDESSFGLRDALRWSDLLIQLCKRQDGEQYECQISTRSSQFELGLGFDIVVLRGLRHGKERSIAEESFKKVFGFEWELVKGFPAIGTAANGSLRVGSARLARLGTFFQYQDLGSVHRPLCTSQLRELQAMCHAVDSGWPVILFPQSAKTSQYACSDIVRTIGRFYGKAVNFIHGASLTDVDEFIGGYRQKEASRLIQSVLPLVEDLMMKHVSFLIDGELHSNSEDVAKNFKAFREASIDLFNLWNSAKADSDSFRAETSNLVAEVLRVLDRLHLSTQDLDGRDSYITRRSSELWVLKERLAEVQTINESEKNAASFEWMKSGLIQAIEAGEWICIDFADHCPPAILDRLNPILERPPGEVEATKLRKDEAVQNSVVLAEAPPDKSGNPVVMRPHADFRLFLSCSSAMSSSGQNGLSRAILDRSLKIVVEAEQDQSIEDGMNYTMLKEGKGDPVHGKSPSSQRLFLKRVSTTSRKHTFQRYALAFGREYDYKRTAQDNEEPVNLATSFTWRTSSRFPSSSTHELDLVLNQHLHLRNRDLMVLRNAPLLPSLSVSKSHLPITAVLCGEGLEELSKVDLELSFHEQSKTLVAAKIAEGFMMASQSLADLNTRGLVLRGLAEASSDGTIRDAYDQVFVASNSFLEEQLSKARESQQPNSKQSAFLLDPLYGCDKASSVIMERRLDRSALRRARTQSKRFRLLQAGIQRFQNAWNEVGKSYCSDTAEGKSTFKKAQAVCDTTGKDMELLWDGHMFEILSFRVLSWIASKCDAIMGTAEKVDQWEVPGERYIFKLFNDAQQLYQEIAASGSPRIGVLASLLVEIRHIVGLLCNKFTMEFLDPSMGLSSDGEVHLERLEKMASRRTFSLMPKTKEGQELEKQFATCGLWERREGLQNEDISMYVKAMASLGCEFVENDSQVLDVLQQVANRFARQGSSQKLRSGQISDWEQIVIVSTVNRLSGIYSTLFPPKISTQTARQEKESTFRAIEEAMSYMKCCPRVCIDSVIGIQQAGWILEKSYSDGKAVDSSNLCSDTRLALTSTFLGEKAECIMSVLASDEDHSKVAESERFAQSFTDVQEEATQFWNFSSQRRQASAMLVSLSAGEHVLGDSRDDCNVLLQASLKSAVMDIQLASSLNVSASTSPMSDVLSLSPEEWSKFKVKRDASDEDELRFFHAFASSRVHEAAQNTPVESYRIVSSVLREMMRSRELQSMAWLSTGLLRLNSFQKNMTTQNSVDPSDVARATVQLCYMKALQASAQVAGYTVLLNNRLGGDSVSESIPVSRAETDFAEYMKGLREASERYTHRSSSRGSYHSFVAMVNNLKSSVLDRVIGSGFLYADRTGSESLELIRRRRVEASDIYTSCENVCEALRLSGAFSHFRDLSANLQLSLREIQIGLAYNIWAKDTASLLLDSKKVVKLNLVQELALFPRASFRARTVFVDLLKRCIACQIPWDGVLTCLEYLADSEKDQNEGVVQEVSAALSLVTQHWKQQSLLQEKRSLQDSSLHVLVEGARKNETSGNAVLDMLEGNEEQDYVNTFNPIPEELEEELLGLNQAPIDSGHVGENGKASEDSVALCSNMFWRIHEKMFPSSGGRGAVRDTNERMQQICDMSAHIMSTLGEDDRTLNYQFSNPWSVFSRILINARMYQDLEQDWGGLGRRDKHHPYNFYTDPNPNEIMRVSEVFKELSNAIERLQTNNFGDLGGHPVLAEVITAMKSVGKHCVLSTPLPRVIVGLERVLRKLEEWQRLFAIEKTRMDSEVSNLARIIARWRRIEISSWKFLLTSRVQSYQESSSKWFFYLYDVVLHESISKNLEDGYSQQRIVSTIDLFLRSAPRGEFKSRLRMIQSLGKHLLSGSDDRHRIALGHALCSVGQYYSLFERAISDDLQNALDTTEAKLKDLTKLVSWKTDIVPDTAVKISGDKEKYLEYYRLKASSERTKRKLHKLCLEVDGFLRENVYECLTKDIRQTGFVTLSQEVDADKAVTQDVAKIEKPSLRELNSILERIRGSILPTARNAVRQELRDLSYRCGSGRLMNLSTLEMKLKKIGKELCKALPSCDTAQQVAGDLRSTIRSRALSLRESKDASIQAKKRALVDLLRALQSMGLSPYEATGKIASWSWLSTPEPSICENFNRLASHIFFTCAKQVNRLHEVTDSRIRNNDISGEEAVRSRAFCSDLLRHACRQRECLNEMYVDAMSAARITASIRLSSPGANIDKLGNVQCCKEETAEFVEIIGRLHTIVWDLEAMQTSLRWTVRSADVEKSQSARSSCQDELWQNCFGQGKDIVINLLGILEKSLNSMKEFLAAPDVQVIHSHSLNEVVISGSLGAAMLSARSLFAKLTSDVKKHYDASLEVSTGNSVAVALFNVVNFLKKSLSEVQSEKKIHEKPDAQSPSAILSNLLGSGELLVEKVLLGAQNLMEWSRMKKSTDDNADGAGYNTLSTKENALSRAHSDVMSLGSLSKLSDIARLLKGIAVDLEAFVSSDPSSVRKASEILALNHCLAAFVDEYIESFIIPCIRKASSYHCHSLALLRTLSSLFTGLCLEGYCRPVDTTEGEDCEAQDHVGVGFGDVGEDDLSMAQDVSEQIEDEEQLLGLKGESDAKPGNNSDQPEKDQDKGVEMATDFEGEFQDIEKESEEEAESNPDDDKQMSNDGGRGEQKVDERLWNDGDDADGDGASDDPEEKSVTPKGNASDIVAKDEQEAPQNSSPDKQPESNGTQAREQDPMDISEDPEQSENAEPGTSDDKETGETEKDKRREEVAKHNGQGEDLNSDDPQEEAQETDEATSQPDHPDKQDREDTVMTGVQPSDAEVDDHKTDDVNDDGKEDDEEPLPEGMSIDGGSESGQDETSGDAAEDDMQEADGFSPTCTADQDDTSPDENGDMNNAGLEHAEAPPHRDESKETERGNVGSTLTSGCNTTGQDANDLEQEAASGENATGNDQLPGPDEPDARKTEQGPGRGSDGSVPGFMKDSGSDALRKRSKDQGPSEEEQSQGTSEKNMDPNPFRAEQQEDLVTKWSKYLTAVDRNSSDEDNEDRDGHEAGGEREFKSKSDLQTDHDELALGVATKDQQKPLPPPESDGSDKGEAEEKTSEATAPLLEKSSQQHISESVADATTKRQELSPKENMDMDEARVQEDVPLLPHAARTAVEMLQAESLDSGHDTRINQALVNKLDGEETEKDSTVRVEESDSKAGEQPPNQQGREVLNPEDARILWGQLSELTSVSASMLCEELRLILEPNSISGLTGGFRTGKRLNMRKVIEFVASDFRKDRIWLRRVKPEKRSYDVLLAIDDSESMSESKAGPLAIKALNIVSSAFAKLEIGRMGVASFGTDAKLVRKFEEPLPVSESAGGQLLQCFSFSQLETNVAKLLELIRVEMSKVGGSLDVEDVKLALIISDGRLSNREEIKQHLRQLKELNVLVAFIIVDHAERDGAGIYNVRRVEYDRSGKVQVLPYMQDFPVEFHAVVQDVQLLPAVLGEALRQWIEVMNAS